MKTLNVFIDEVDPAGLQGHLRTEIATAETVVRQAGLAIDAIDTRLSADMHYAGQTHTVAVALPPAGDAPLTRMALHGAFEGAYRVAFGRTLDGSRVRLVNIRVAAIGRRPRFDFAILAPEPGARLDDARRGNRPVWFDGWRETAIFDRLALPVGAEIAGPAILEQPDTTTVIDPGLVARIDRLGNAIVALPGRLAPLAQRFRNAGGWMVATQFTLVPGRDGAPLISPHLQALRPFLGRGDFLPGAWGHRTVDALQPMDLAVEKIAYSAFYMTRLEWVLRRCGITRLFVGGIVTNGGVASSVRDAQIRDFDVTLLEDGCAAFSDSVHAATVTAPAACAG